MYVTYNLSLDYRTINLNPNAASAEQELREYIRGYYGVPFEAIAALQGCYAGSAESCVEWLRGFVNAGARPIVLRLGSFDFASQLKRVTRDLLPRLLP